MILGWVKISMKNNRISTSSWGGWGTSGILQGTRELRELRLAPFSSTRAISDIQNPFVFCETLVSGSFCCVSLPPAPRSPDSFSLLKAFCLCFLLLFAGVRDLLLIWNTLPSFFLLCNRQCVSRGLVSFFSLLPELFVCLLSYHRKIFWNKNGSVAAAVFSNPCASRALKLESSHRRTNRRRRNRIETGGFLLDSHQQLSFLLLVNLLEIFLHLVR